jgi:dihydrolipoamide dehydrogenase
MKFDIVVIGGGPAGKKSSISLANAGKSVCLIEKNENHIGGTCLNEGCIPAKLYLESVSYLGKQKYMQSCGLSVGEVSFDMTTLKEKKDNLLGMIRKGALQSIKKAGVKVVFGEASFIDEKSIKVGDEVIEGEKFIITTGSIHRPHPLLEVDKKQIISSDEVFELQKIPSSVLVVGGGAIGCEFATFFNNLGSSVQIAEFTPTLVPNEDKDIADTLKRELGRKGIKVVLETNVSNVTKSSDGVEVVLQMPKGEVKQKFELILVSIGRVPNTENLKLQNASIETQRGFVSVDENLKTTNPNVYAIGDVISTPALAHMAYNESKVVVNNILNEKKKTPSKIIPFVTFCTPQVASVGASEKTLKKDGVEYDVTKSFFKSNQKAKIKGDDAGFIKLICDKSSGVILGGAIIGEDATELIHEILIAVNQKLTKSDIAEMVFAHPTLSEILGDMV